MLNERPELRSEKGFRGLMRVLGEWKCPDVNNPYKNFLIFSVLKRKERKKWSII